jgi:argininosuccinate lyase
MSSFTEDRALVDIDIDVSEAHALALGRAGLFDQKDLKRVLAACEKARRKVRPLLERGAGRGFHDIHPLVEKSVIEMAGEEAGGRIHLGKSRNDQVAADICIFTRRRLMDVMDGILLLAAELVRSACAARGQAVPAYTHARPGQATTWAHFLLAHASGFRRDYQRVLWCRNRLNRSPLGSCAAAGTSVPVARELTARLLGFDGVWENSLDATSARDHVLETLSVLAIFQGGLSRLAADVIMMSGPETGVLVYPDGWADTSSAMPQKRNPDPLELVRARAAESAGLAAAGFGIMHGLTSGYNRDLQELKPLLWKSMAMAGAGAAVVRHVVSRLRTDQPRVREILAKGYAAALDVAEWLTLRKGVPFRRAHHAVGILVRELAAHGRSLADADPAGASRVLSRAAGRPLPFTAAEWRTAIPSPVRRGAGAGEGRVIPSASSTGSGSG